MRRVRDMVRAMSEHEREDATDQGSHQITGRTPTMAGLWCLATDGGRTCILGPDHEVDYHAGPDGSRWGAGVVLPYRDVPVQLTVGHLPSAVVGTIRTGDGQTARSVAALLREVADVLDGPLRQRPGDQPLPVPNGSPDIQSMVIDDLQAVPPYQLDAAQRVAADVAARREVGIQRYGTALQAGNGRDAARDLYEEVVDGMVYARQVLAEGCTVADVYRPGGVSYVYERLQHLAMTVRQMLDGEEPSHE